MIAKLTQTLQRLTTDWAAQLQPDAIQAACDAVGYTQWRDRLLNPVVTVQGCWPRSRRRPFSATQHNPTTSLVGISFHCHET